MFTDEDYRAYFSELETIFKNSLIIYTDLLNALSDQSIRSKLYTIVTENMESYRLIKTHKEQFSGNTERAA